MNTNGSETCHETTLELLRKLLLTIHTEQRLLRLRIEEEKVEGKPTGGLEELLAAMEHERKVLVKLLVARRQAVFNKVEVGPSLWSIMWSPTMV